MDSWVGGRSVLFDGVAALGFDGEFAFGFGFNHFAAWLSASPVPRNL